MRIGLPPGASSGSGRSQKPAVDEEPVQPDNGGGGGGGGTRQRPNVANSVVRGERPRCSCSFSSDAGCRGEQEGGRTDEDEDEDRSEKKRVRTKKKKKEDEAVPATETR